MKFLVVDDEFVGREKAGRIMSEFGKCDLASTGAQAVEMFLHAHESGIPYDCITLDISMPDMSGVDVLNKIRKWEADNGKQVLGGVKVIMLTASVDQNNVMSSYIGGCQEYIIKPFDKSKIEAVLKDIGLLSTD